MLQVSAVEKPGLYIMSSLKAVRFGLLEAQRKIMVMVSMVLEGE